MNLGVGKILGNRDPVAQIFLFSLLRILRFAGQFQASSAHLRQRNGLRKFGELARRATTEQLVVREFLKRLF